jgi:hypothetical protein
MPTTCPSLLPAANVDLQYVPENDGGCRPATSGSFTNSAWVATRRAYRRRAIYRDRRPPVCPIDLHNRRLDQENDRRRSPRGSQALCRDRVGLSASCAADIAGRSRVPTPYSARLSAPLASRRRSCADPRSMSGQATALLVGIGIPALHDGNPAAFAAAIKSTRPIFISML